MLVAMCPDPGCGHVYAVGARATALTADPSTVPSHGAHTGVLLQDAPELTDEPLANAWLAAHAGATLPQLRTAIVASTGGALAPG